MPPPAAEHRVIAVDLPGFCDSATAPARTSPGPRRSGRPTSTPCIDGVGHLVALEAPDRLAAVLLDVFVEV